MSVGLLESRDVAKGMHGGRRPGSGRPKGERDDITVKLERSIVARARYVADIRGITLAEYLSESLRPVVDRDFAKAAKGTDQP